MNCIPHIAETFYVFMLSRLLGDAARLPVRHQAVRLLYYLLPTYEVRLLFLQYHPRRGLQVGMRSSAAID